MPIINRAMDRSQKKEWVQWDNGFGQGPSLLIQTGQTILIAGPMPFPGMLQSGQVYATGVSNSPQISLSIQRFVAGSGFTNITVGISNMVVQAVSTSGPLGLSGLPVQGSTLLNFLTGDCFMVTTSGANTAISSLALQLVVVKTQDIVTHNSLIV